LLIALPLVAPQKSAPSILKKGSSTFVADHLRLDTWQDKTTNQTRSKLKVVIDNLQLIGGSPATQTPSPTGRSKPAPDFSRPPRDRDPDLDSDPGGIPY
jgi:single-stranded DNA-binding protein